MTPGPTGGSTGDAISVHDLQVLCHVGVPEAERAALQPIALDLDLTVDLARAGDTDDVVDTVDYGSVVVAVEAAVTAAPVALLERLAQLAARAAFDVDQRVAAVTVSVRKLRPPVPANVRSTAVRIHRTRA